MQVLSIGIMCAYEVVVTLGRKKELFNSDHFSVGGVLIQAWVSQKSFRQKEREDNEGKGAGRNAKRDSRVKKRLNKTHGSCDDPELIHYKNPKVAYLGHTVIVSRNGLIVKTKACLADGYGYGERKTV
ncbi:MAG: hypothetical protein KUG80_08025 [Gammaproteobacteria bacterium]|nr:hypothetical protein [Gammaproteobacteria bacterium]